MRPEVRLTGSKTYLQEDGNFFPDEQVIETSGKFRLPDVSSRMLNICIRLVF